MIRIKDFISNENEIVFISESDDNELHIMLKNDFDFYVDGTFKDIEWNYGNNISESLSYDLAKARVEELEEENERLSVELNNCMIERNDYLSKIDKTIKYLKLKVDIPKNHLEEAINDMQEDLLKILGGEE